MIQKRKRKSDGGHLSPLERCSCCGQRRRVGWFTCERKACVEYISLLRRFVTMAPPA